MKLGENERGRFGRLKKHLLNYITFHFVQNLLTITMATSPKTPEFKTRDPSQLNYALGKKQKRKNEAYLVPKRPGPGRPNFIEEKRPGPKSKYTVEQRQEKKEAMKLHLQNKRKYEKKTFVFKGVERRVTRGSRSRVEAVELGEEEAAVVELSPTVCTENIDKEAVENVQEHPLDLSKLNTGDEDHSREQQMVGNNISNGDFDEEVDVVQEDPLDLTMSKSLNAASETDENQEDDDYEIVDLAEYL